MQKICQDENLTPCHLYCLVYYLNCYTCNLYALFFLDLLSNEMREKYRSFQILFHSCLFSSRFIILLTFGNLQHQKGRKRVSSGYVNRQSINDSGAHLSLMHLKYVSFSRIATMTAMPHFTCSCLYLPNEHVCGINGSILAEHFTMVI